MNRHVLGSSIISMLRSACDVDLPTHTQRREESVKDSLIVDITTQHPRYSIDDAAVVDEAHVEEAPPEQTSKILIAHWVVGVPSA